MKHNSNDEYLEAIWVLEEGTRATVSSLAEHFGPSFDPARVDELVDRGHLTRSPDGTLHIAGEGLRYTRSLIRSHRIAERLIHDVLGQEFEPGACEFEHVTNVGMVDAICTLLGHPRECPHGLPIPQGECCRQSLAIVRRKVVPLTELDAGQSARIAYVYSHDDSQLHIVEGLQIRPGEHIKLHQKYPTYVVEVDRTNVALDPEVAASVQVWADTATPVSRIPEHTHNRRRRRAGLFGRRFRRE